MPDRTVADALVARLAAWRVPRVFGQPGEAVAPLVEALATTGDPEFVPARNGESAAFMATGHARFTGEIGVCLAAEGSGLFGLLSGLAAARRAGLPVLAIVGTRAPHPSADPHRVGRLFAGLCQHVRYAGDPGRAPEVVDEALRTAVTAGGPVCLVLPRHLEPGSRQPTGAAGPVDARLVFAELSTRLPGGGAVTVDGDAILTRYAHHLHLAPGLAVLPGDTPGAGGALPYAVAAKLAAPDRPVLALVTDEGMQAYGLAELVTVARRWSAWPDPRLVVLVLNTRSGHRRYPDPARPTADDVPYAGWARLLGLHGVRVDRPELVGAAWDEALAADRPCLLEMVVEAGAGGALWPGEVLPSGARGAGTDVGMRARTSAWPR